MFNLKKNLKLFAMITIFSTISLTSFGANDTVAGASKKVGEKWTNKVEKKEIDSTAGATKKVGDKWTNKKEEIVVETSKKTVDMSAGATKKVGDKWTNKKEVIVETTTTSEKTVDVSAGATKKGDKWTNKKEFKKDYIALSESNNGITSKLEVIYENDKIVDLKYEEISSTKKEDNKNLKTFTDIIRKEVLKSQSLVNFSTDNLDLNLADIKTFYNNYMSLAKKIKPKK